MSSILRLCPPIKVRGHVALQSPLARFESPAWNENTVGYYPFPKPSIPCLTWQLKINHCPPATSTPYCYDQYMLRYRDWSRCPAQYPTTWIWRPDNNNSPTSSELHCGRPNCYKLWCHCPGLHVQNRCAGHTCGEVQTMSTLAMTAHRPSSIEIEKIFFYHTAHL